MKRTAALFAIVITASNAWSQTPTALTYKGWAIGISFDSAQKLALRDIHTPLSCQGLRDEPLACTGVVPKLSGGMVTVRLSSPPRRVINIGLLEPIDARASTDSVKRAFTKLWGKPVDLSAAARKTGRPYPVKPPLGIWIIRGATAGVSVTELLGSRKLNINISGPEDMRNQMIAAFKRKGLSDDSIRVLMKRVPRFP